MKEKLLKQLEASPVIAAVRDHLFDKALQSPVDVIFLLGCDIMSIKQRIDAAHQAGKTIFVHIDLAEGVGKDKCGIRFLSQCGVDGIISTKSNLIRQARELGLITVQRFFAYDSHGIDGILDVLGSTRPDIFEIMPGVIGKIINRFSNCGIPMIAGGLIETKQELTSALKQGAYAVSTGSEALWYE